MSNDPIGFRDVHSFNRYAYANNNPYKYVDPDGKESIRFSRPNLSTMMYEMFGYKTRDEANKNFSKDVASASKKVAVDATVGTLIVVAYNANGIAKAAGNGALIPSPVSPFLAKVSGGATVISAVADGALDLMDDQIPREGVRDLVAVVIAQQVEKIALRRGASHEVAASIEVGAKKIVQSVMKAEPEELKKR